jgi:hypothetical protein
VRVVRQLQGWPPTEAALAAAQSIDNVTQRPVDNHATINGPRCCDSQGMAVQTSFAKKMTGSRDCNHRLLALLGNDSELDLALLNVEDRVRDVALRENNLIRPVF